MKLNPPIAFIRNFYDAFALTQQNFTSKCHAVNSAVKYIFSTSWIQGETVNHDSPSASTQIVLLSLRANKTELTNRPVLLPYPPEVKTLNLSPEKQRNIDINLKNTTANRYK